MEFMYDTLCFSVGSGADRSRDHYNMIMKMCLYILYFTFTMLYFAGAHVQTVSQVNLDFNHVANITDTQMHHDLGNLPCHLQHQGIRHHPVPPKRA